MNDPSAVTVIEPELGVGVVNWFANGRRAFPLSIYAVLAIVGPRLTVTVVAPEPQPPPTPVEARVH